MLEINCLTKRFGRHTAIDNLTLAARPGEVLALLGPNGAGKTTTIRCAVGLATPNSGNIVVAGHDTGRSPLAARRAIGFVPDRAWFYPKVSARELLRYIAGVRKVPEADAEISQLLERFQISRYADNLGLGLAARVVLDLSPILAVAVPLAAASSAIAMTGLAVGVGAAHPKFDFTNANELVMTPAAIAFMTLAISHAAVVAVLLVRPAWNAIRFPDGSGYWASGEGVVIVAALLLLTVAVTLLPLVHGARRLHSSEH